MGTGDYVCLTLRGGAPWGFTLKEGEGDIYRPLLVSQVEDGSHACLAGVQEGDEVVSINGEPCADLTLSQALALIETSINNLQLLLKRYIISSDDSDSEGTYLGKTVSSDENFKSTTLHTISSKSEIPKEICIFDPQGNVLHRELDSDNKAPIKGNLSDDLGDHELDFKHENEVERCFSPGEFVELQVSLSKQTLDNGVCTSLGSAQGIKGDFSTIETTNTTSTSHVPYTNREPLGQHGLVVSAPSVDVTLQPPDASEAGRGALSVGGSVVIEDIGLQREEKEGGGLCQPVPGSFTVSFEIPSDEAAFSEEQEGSDSEGDQGKPNKHRARHARLRRNESLSEKQLKENKSKSKRIALLLSAAPSNPHNKGLLMFKKHRQRAKQFTLVSYGTGEDEPEFSDEEDEVNGDEKQENPAGEFSLQSTIDPKSTKRLPLIAASSKGVLTFTLKKSLLEMNNNLNNQVEMECLPETKGKGALMFAQRRQRMDEITAEHEELRRQGLPVEATQTLEKKVVEQSYIQSPEGHAYMDVNMHQQNQQQYQQYQEQQYYEQQQKYQQQHQQYQQYQQQQQYEQQYQQQQLYQQQQQYHQEQHQMHHYSTNTNGTIHHETNEIQGSFSNRTAKPFTAENVVATPYSHATSGTNQDSVGQGENIASRDERISTPAIRTGLLLDSRKKNTSKPMFTFKEAPKVSPNPALLNLLNRNDKKGFESGPEEDYLSLGAEACNFLQAQRLKPKIPPPVAPKPMINPNSPPWSAQIEAANQDIPQCAENSLSTPAAAPTTENDPASELKPTTAPAPEPSTLHTPEETTANPTTEQQTWTLPKPESQQKPPQVAPKEAHEHMISAQHSETSQNMSWGLVSSQAHQQSSASSWQLTQMQPQNPPPSQSPPQPPWVTQQPTQNQPNTNTWTSHGQPSWTKPGEQAQPQTNAQPPWAQPQEQLQSQIQVQPQWMHTKKKPLFQQTHQSWNEPQVPVETQPRNQWTQPSQTYSQQQTPWAQQVQQKPQVQPPWVQQVQPNIQPQPPSVQQVQPETQSHWGQQHPALPQSWANNQVPGQPQPPWVSTPPHQQPHGNLWPASQSQVQSQPSWMNAPEVCQAQVPVNLNPWAPVPENPPQTSWAQYPPENGGEQQTSSWTQEQNPAQHQPPWAPAVPSQLTQQSNWQQSFSSTSQQPQPSTWSSGQAQPPTPVNEWRPQLSQTPVNVSMSAVNTQSSPKPWHPTQNQTPPPPPRRMVSYTVGQKAASPVNPMATVLNPKMSQGSAFEMPVVKGKGADMFAKRQSRMEKFVVDSETVEANKASRSTSPAASLPNEWKYTPNVRAPPPRAYNPIQSPFYPPAATKQLPACSHLTKAKKKDPEKTMPAPKPLNVIDVMKHQPYKLDSALFIFGPGAEASKPPVPKPSSPPSTNPDTQTIKYEQMAPVQQAGQFTPPYPQGYGIPIQPAMHDPQYQHAQANVYQYPPPPGGVYQQDYNQQYQQPVPPPYPPQAPQPLNLPYQQPAYQPASSPPYMATPSLQYKAQPSSSYNEPSFPSAPRLESVSGGNTGAAPKPKFTANKSSAQVWKPTSDSTYNYPQDGSTDLLFCLLCFTDCTNMETILAMGRSYSLSPPSRIQFKGQKSMSASSSPKPPTRVSTNPTVTQTSHLGKGFKPLTPWEAASRHPLGLVDEAFAFQDLQQSLASNVHLAACRKILPEPPVEWKGRISYPAQQKSGTQAWSQGCGQSRAPIASFMSPLRSPASSPVNLVGYRSLPRQWQPQRYGVETNQRASMSASKRPTYMSAYTNSTLTWRR